MSNVMCLLFILEQDDCEPMEHNSGRCQPVRERIEG